MIKQIMYKVLHIITRYMNSGGAEKNTRFNIECLDKEKYEIHLALGSDSKLYPEDLGAKIIRIKPLKRNICPFCEIAAIAKIFLLIKKEKYDLVHTHQSKAGFLGRLAAKLAGTPVIVHTLHGQLFYEGQNFLVKRFYIFLERFCEKFTDKIISVGEDLKNYYLKNKIGDESKYLIIRSNIGLEKFKKAGEMGLDEINRMKREIGIKNSWPIVGMIGRIEKSKGWEKALEAAEKVLNWNQSVKFVFVGDGKLKPALEKRISEKGLKDNFIFIGFRKDVENIIAVFNVFISTSLREGLSQTFVQAAAMGKPMVVFEVLGAHEMVKENGFIVPREDADAMAEKIVFLLFDLERAREIGKRGVVLADFHWSAEEIREKTVELYENLLREDNLI